MTITNWNVTLGHRPIHSMTHPNTIKGNVVPWNQVLLLYPILPCFTQTHIDLSDGVHAGPHPELSITEDLKDYRSNQGNQDH